MSADEAMNYCQTVHDLRQCPVAVGSPQTQTQRDQVTRIIGIAEAQEKQFRSLKAMAGQSKTESSPNRFTFEGITEGENADNQETGMGTDGASLRETNQPRSESVDSNSSAPSHPVKKSSSREDDEESATGSTPDQQPQKYQAIEPNRGPKVVKKSLSSVGEASPPKRQNDFPPISSAAAAAATMSSGVDDRDTVTPNIDQGAAVADPHLDPADKSGNELRVSSSTTTADCSESSCSVPDQTSSSSWFFKGSQGQATSSAPPAQPKPPKENQSSSSWKGSLKGLRKWSTGKFKTPPSSPSGSGPAPDSPMGSDGIATGSPIDSSASAGINDTAIGPPGFGTAKSSSFHGNSGVDDQDSDNRVRVPELVKSQSEKDKAPTPTRQGRKWSLPNPLKKNVVGGQSANSPSSPAVGPTVISAKGMEFTPR
jgi:hypothetical protein